jgi:hypothetical protein
MGSPQRTLLLLAVPFYLRAIAMIIQERDDDEHVRNALSIAKIIVRPNP